MPRKSDKAKEPSAIIALQVRMREDLRARIEDAASNSGRPMNSEVVDRLEASFDADSVLGNAAIKTFLLAVGQEIARAERATGKGWTTDVATYFVAKNLVDDVFKRSRPKADNEDEINAWAFELHNGKGYYETLTKTLTDVGAIGYPNALSAIGPGSPSRIKLPEAQWRLPGTPEEPVGEPELKQIREWLLEWEALTARRAELLEKIDGGMAGWRAAKASGEAIYRSITESFDREEAAPSDGS